MKRRFWPILFACFTFCSIHLSAQNIIIDELEINDENYTSIDFGTIPVKKRSRRILHIRNTSNKTLKITKIEEGCECTTAILKKTVLKPKKSTRLILKWKPISSTEFHSSIMIHSNAINHPELWIQMEGNINSAS